MSEAERRTGYISGRVLIEAERILNPQFRAQGITLDGAQVELLRNMTQYLHRKTTFVDEYADGYYLRVTEDDFDTISDIVASLEVKLMTNDNTLWGYNDRLVWQDDDVCDNGSVFSMSIGPVPSDEVWIVENALVRHDGGTNKSCGFALYADAEATFFTPVFQVPTITWYGGPTNLTVGPGDSLLAYIWGLAVGKTFQFSGTGYKMKVPQ